MESLPLTPLLGLELALLLAFSILRFCFLEAIVNSYVMVGEVGIEPTTPGTQNQCATIAPLSVMASVVHRSPLSLGL